MRRYILGTNIEGQQLFRKTKEGTQGKKVAVYEDIFDIIHEAHIHLAHARSVRTHKILIDDIWFGIPENAMLVYCNICPECLPSTRVRVPASEKLNPLHTIVRFK